MSFKNIIRATTCLIAGGVLTKILINLAKSQKTEKDFESDIDKYYKNLERTHWKPEPDEKKCSKGSLNDFIKELEIEAENLTREIEEEEFRQIFLLEEINDYRTIKKPQNRIIYISPSTTNLTKNHSKNPAEKKIIFNFRKQNQNIMSWNPIDPEVGPKDDKKRYEYINEIFNILMRKIRDNGSVEENFWRPYAAMLCAQTAFYIQTTYPQASNIPYIVKILEHSIKENEDISPIKEHDVFTKIVKDFKEKIVTNAFNAMPTKEQKTIVHIIKTALYYLNPYMPYNGFQAINSYKIDENLKETPYHIPQKSIFIITPSQETPQNEHILIDNLLATYFLSLENTVYPHKNQKKTLIVNDQWLLDGENNNEYIWNLIAENLSKNKSIKIIYA